MDFGEARAVATSFEFERRCVERPAIGYISGNVPPCSR